MKHILSFLTIVFFTQLNAQNVSVRAYWPDGSLVQIPLTLNMEFEGCPIANSSFVFDDGTYGLQYVNPLLLNCESVRFYLTGEANPRSGVSALDLVVLTKHFLGIKPLTTYLQFLAADANYSYSLSALDIVEIRKLILGLQPTLPEDKALRFLVKTTPMPPPITVTNIEESKTFPIPGAATWNIDFWVVKVGDIK